MRSALPRDRAATHPSPRFSAAEVCFLGRPAKAGISTVATKARIDSSGGGIHRSPPLLFWGQSYRGVDARSGETRQGKASAPAACEMGGAFRTYRQDMIQVLGDLAD